MGANRVIDNFADLAGTVAATQLSTSGAAAGTYPNATVTVDIYGRVTTIVSGSSGSSLAIGNAIGNSPTVGCILLVGAGGLLSQDTALEWDSTNHRLRINAADVVIANGTAMLNLGRGAAGSDGLHIWADSGGSGDCIRVTNFSNNTDLFVVQANGEVLFSFLSLRGATPPPGVGLACGSAGAGFPAAVFFANSGQTSDVVQVRDNLGNPLSGFGPLGALKLPTLADGAATNGSLYLSSTNTDVHGSPKLCRKDSAGNVNIIG